MMSEADLRRLVAFAKERGCLLLVDETYRDLALTEKLPLAASLGDHVIGVASLPKAFGVPGIRVGWVINRSPALMEQFLAAKEQISICGSVINEWVEEQILAQRDAFLTPTHAEWLRGLDRVAKWIAGDPMLDWEVDGEEGGE